MKKKVSFISSSKSLFTIKVLLYLLCTALVFIVSFEIYNPLANKDRENKVDIYQNKFIKSLPPTITVAYNNIGYTGEDYSDTITRKKAVFIGSSTTQSLYVPYENKWTTVAMEDSGYWFNNCGIDGLHIDGIIDEIRKVAFLKPNYVVVLLDPFNDGDIKAMDIRKSEESTSGSLKSKLKNIEFIKSVALPYIRSKFLTGIGHREVDWGVEPLDNNENRTVPSLNSVPGLISKLNKTIDSIGAIPVLVSQATPYGNYINEEGILMENLKKSSYTDKLYRNFNSTLKEYCELNDINYINGYSLEKGTHLFYDYTHFNLEGSYEFGKLVGRDLKEVFLEN